MGPIATLEKASRPMTGTMFLFMDERYPDESLPEHLHYAGLTGVLVDSADQIAFREIYYRALAAAYPAPENTVPLTPKVHASDLFRDLGREGDEIRVQFLEAIVDALVSLQISVLNIGYYRTKEHLRAFRLDKQAFGKRVLSLCFLGFLWSLEEVLKHNIVWPVVERDRSDLQETIFSAVTRDADHAIARVLSLKAAHSVDFSRLGETLYSNKFSALTSASDICNHLLHKKFLKNQGATLGEYAMRLANLADKLTPVVSVNQIIRMKVD